MLLLKQLAVATINRKIQSVKSLFKWALSKKIINNNCAIHLIPLKPQTHERHYLTEEKLQQFSQHITHPTIRVIAQFIANTGLRISECTQLLLSDVDFEQCIVHVLHGKGDKSRVVPLNHRTVLLLKQYLQTIRPKNSNSLYFFALAKTGSISPQYINSVFKKASHEMQHPQLITCHILRHTFASNLVKHNVHIAIIQKLLGHANVRTTSIYMHTDFQALQQAVHSLES
ncbi:tyrosine-type recombinase/integrase [Lysinibacillus sp. NPDC098008]|uniref:tyrosine-type recombinase/integrase n=1 Tax=Lysinibacillus sp. NPDC098008 TaxID=3364146 RepID=UPI0037F5419A